MATSQKPPLAAQYRFGPFEVETRPGELYKSGASVRLQAQPFRVLCTLIEHAGEVVSREELQRQIWGAGTTGDLDHGLDVAINKLRDVLEDAADAPQYIE